MSKYKNIVFDLGGVIIDIDTRKTISAFEKIIKKQSKTVNLKDENILDNKIFFDYEKGLLTDYEFRVEFNKLLNINITNEEFDCAFNSLLLDYNTSRIKILEQLMSRYRIFLMSNTCHIHYLHYNKLLEEKYNIPGLSYFFEEMFLSFHVGMRKPDKEFFEYVLDCAGLNPEETIFIDDNKENTDGANLLGIHGIHKPANIELISAVSEFL